MNAHAQIIYMQSYTKKILILILIISFFVICLFFTQNYLKNQLASLSGIITARVTINPLEVKVSAPAEVEVDRNFKVEATIFNKGGETIEKARAEIFLPSGLVLIGRDSVHEIKVIPAKRERKISWQVKGEEIGSYIILVSASGELKGEIISAEGNTLVEVEESVSRGGVQSWFQNFFDFFQERLGF